MAKQQNPYEYDLTAPPATTGSRGVLRYVGADVSQKTQASSIQIQEPGAPNVKGLQYLDQAGKTLQGSLENESRNAATRRGYQEDAAQAIESSISSAVTAAETQAKAKMAQGNRVTGLETFAAAIGELVKQRQSKAEAERKAIADQQYTQAFEEVQKLKVAWREKGLDEQGVSAYQAALNETLRKYPGLENEALRKLTDDGYSVALQYASEKSHKQQDYLEKLTTQQRDVTASGLMFQLNGDLGRLKANITDDPEPIIEGIRGKIATYLDQVGDPLTAVMTLNTAFKATLEKLDSRSEAFAKLSAQQEAIQEYGTYTLEVNERVEKGELTPAEAKVMRQQKRNELNLLGSYEDPTPFEGRRMLREYLEQENGIQRLTEEQAITQSEAMRMSPNATSYLAWSIINNPAVLDYLKVNKAFSANPGVRAAVRLAEQYKGGEKERKSLQLQMASVRTQLAELDKSNVMQFISKAEQARSSPSASTNDILNALSGLPVPKPAGPKGWTPEEAQQANAAFAAVRQTLLQKFQTLESQYAQSQSELAAYGLVGSREQIELAVKKGKDEYDAFTQAFPKKTSAPGGQGAQSPFDAPRTMRSSRTGSSAPTNIRWQTTTYKGKQIRLPFMEGANVSHLNNYAEQRGERNHAGEDLPVPVGTKLVSPVGGKIIRIEDHGDEGYGQMLDVLGDDGMLYRYAHLQRGALFVQPGARVEAGGLLARTGNTGRSSGPHLHFEVRDPKKPWGFDGTVDPLAYLGSHGVKSAQGSKPRTLSDKSWHLPSVQSPGMSAQNKVRIPANALALPGGYYVLDGKLKKLPGKDWQDSMGRATEANKAYKAAHPIMNGVASRNKKDYGPNDPNANYGYAALASDKAFTKKLAQVSTKLGIPAMWLVDLMHYETAGTFASSVDNGLGYSGLIQFGDDTARGLGTSRAALSRMSRVQQLDYVYKYLSEFGSDLQKGPEWVVAAVWGGNALVQDMRRRGADVAIADPSWNDYGAGGNMTFAKYMRVLGNGAGRRYGTVDTRRARVSSPVHTNAIAGCSMCNAIKTSNSNFLPHEAPIG